VLCCKLDTCDLKWVSGRVLCCKLDIEQSGPLLDHNIQLFLRLPHQLRQYLYSFCTSKASKLQSGPLLDHSIQLFLRLPPQMRQYLFFCTSKASKLRTSLRGSMNSAASAPLRESAFNLQRLLRQYLYFCTSKASKLRTASPARRRWVLRGV